MTGEVEGRLKQHATELGFALVGIARPDPSAHAAFFRGWLERGAHGEMSYLARPDAVARRADPRLTLESVRSVVVVAHEYFSEDASASLGEPAVGVIARYARGRDYHKVMKARLRRLLEWIVEAAGREVQGRAYVDTGPVLERELASRAGLGWFGKNTMLINPRRGSWFFLGCLFLDLELAPDEPFRSDHCGTCTRCLEACPTGALLGRDESGAPVIDARRCISYLTIEQRGPIPPELRPLLGNRIYGCDICQEVCPWNAKVGGDGDPAYAARGPGERPLGVEALPGEGVSAATSEVPGSGHPGTRGPSLLKLLRMTPEDWEAFSRGSALRRAGYAGFKRNVAVAIGNWLASLDQAPVEAVATLRDALRDEEPLVREHAAWALAQGRASAE
jgi:epoxyqueuosine reductase